MITDQRIQSKRISSVWAVLLLVMTALLTGSSLAVEPRPAAVPEELRRRLGLDSFYQKYLDVDGLPVLGSARVSDNALAEAAWIVRHMLDGREDILQAMVEQNVRAVVMAADEYTTDIPEHSGMRPKVYWDRRARGLGATPRIPVVSGGEENLLNYQRDPYPDENIFLHEFAHAIHRTGLNQVDPTFDDRLCSAYQSARDQGLWENTYTSTNTSEYWAEGVQAWFDDNAPPDALHNDVRTRTKLKAYDPGLAALCEEVFGDRPWRYVKPRDRAPEDRMHLAAYDPNNLPRFRWREAPLSDRSRVVIQTAAGDLEVTLAPECSESAVTNFLRIALDGGYHSGLLERVEGGGVWATVNPTWRDRWSGDLLLEDIPESTSKPTRGSIVLVRDHDGWNGFAIFLGETIDVGTSQVIPIGHVTRGIDVIRSLLDSPSRDGMLTNPVEIRRVIREE